MSYGRKEGAGDDFEVASQTNRIHQYRRDPRLLLRAAQELPKEEFLRMLVHARQETPDIIERFVSFMQVFNSIPRPLPPPGGMPASSSGAPPVLPAPPAASPPEGIQLPPGGLLTLYRPGDRSRM